MKTKIDRLQYFFTIPNILFGKAIGITAGVIVRRIGADTWSSMLIGFIFGTIMVIIMTYVSSKFPDKTIIQYSQDILGKFFGKFVGLILAIFFTVAFMVSANVITLHLSEYFLPQTPFLILCAIYVLLCSYGVVLGVEVIVRFSFFGFILAALLNLTMISGTVRDFHLVNLRPLLDKGIIANIYNSIYLFTDIAMVIFVTGVIYPMLNEKKRSISISFWAMVVSTIMIIIWPISEIGVMGADVMKQFAVVCMQQVRSAQLSIYFPRYELIMVVFFVWAMFVQSALMLFCSMYSFKQVMNIKKDWKIFFPLIVITITGTYYIGRDHNEYIQFLTFPWGQICLVLSIGIPLMLLLIGVLRKKFESRKLI